MPKIMTARYSIFYELWDLMVVIRYL